MMKRWLILFPLLLMGCFHLVPDEASQTPIFEEEDVTLKIMNGEKDATYLIEIVPTDNKKHEPIRVLTDENHEATAPLEAEATYTLFVMETDATRLEELKTDTFDEDVIIENIQLFQITPSIEMKTINIDLKQCADC